MKILKIIHGYPPDYNAGSEVYSQSICNELAKKHEVVIFTREENPYAADYSIRAEVRDHLPLYLVNKAREKEGYRHHKLDQKFGELLEQIKPDIAHIGHLNHLSTGIVKELKSRNIPIVFTLHDFWLMCPRGQFLQINFGVPDFHQLCERQENLKCATRCYNRYFSGITDEQEKETSYWQGWVESRMNEMKSIIEDIDMFIAPSKYLLNRFVNDFNIPRNKIIYLDYGFPLQYLSPLPGKAQGRDFTFGYIGTHIPAKGVDLLVRAFSRISKSAVLRIWGRDNGQTTRNLKILARQCPGKVEFHGEYVNKNLAREVFSQVNCIVVPSVWAENSPLVIHEAQACHIPVITADFGGMGEYVKHLTNGLLFRHRDGDDLAEKMSFALEHPQLMQQLGSCGYLHSEDGRVPDITTHCSILENIYQLFVHEAAPDLAVNP